MKKEGMAQKTVTAKRRLTMGIYVMKKSMKIILPEIKLL